MKKYRVDCFGKQGMEQVQFESELDAVRYGEQAVNEGKAVYLLRLIDCIEKYEVIRAL